MQNPAILGVTKTDNYILCKLYNKWGGKIAKLLFENYYLLRKTKIVLYKLKECVSIKSS